MSHPLYNPYAPKRRPAESDLHKGSSLMGLGPLGSSSGRLQASESQAIPALVPNYRPSQRAKTNEDIPVLNQDTRRQEFRSPGTAGSYQNIRHFDGSGDSLGRSSNYGRAAVDDSLSSSAYYQPSTSAGRSLFSSSDEKDRDIRPIPSRDYDQRDVAKSPVPAQPRYTSETAASILVHFGLEKDDLEHLITYPEDQITPENLPFILRQIRIQKSKKASDASRPKPFTEANRGGPASGDSWRGPGPAGMERATSHLLQSSKVIDYGHTSKYAGRLDEDVDSRVKRAEGDSLLTLDNLDRISRDQELAQQAARSASLAPPTQDREGLSSFITSILKSPSSKSHDLPSVKSTFPPFSLPPKDTDARNLKPQALTPPSFERVQDQPKPAVKLQLSAALLRSAHPSRPDLVVLSGNDAGGGGNQRQNLAPVGADKSQKPKTPAQQSSIKKGPPPKQEFSQKPPEAKKKQPPPKTQAKPLPKTPAKPPPKTRAKPSQLAHGTQTKPPQQAPKAQTKPSQPLLPTPRFPQVAWQQGYPAGQQFPPVPLASPIPSLLSTIPMFGVNPSHGVVHVPQAPPTQVPVFKGLPTAAMMLDYAAATPRVFPHKCSLCNKGCAQMKDWIAHQNTNLHLESCKVLRKQYPNWDGEVLHVREDEKPKKSVSSTQSQSKKRHRDTRSNSRSSSPRGRRSPDTRTRKKTRSRSPHTPKYERRSRSYSTNSSDYRRSRSRSYERRPRRRSQEEHSSRKSRERRSPPRRHSPPRKRSTSRSRHDRHSSPKRSRERRSPPKRSNEESAASRKSQQAAAKAERLAKKLLESSAVQSLSKQSDLETMVKTLAPALLAELAKMKPAPSTSSRGGAASTSTAAASATSKKPVVAKTTSSDQKASFSKTKSVKGSVPTMVTLGGIHNSLDYYNIVSAAGQFGKTKSVVLFRTKKQAMVCFEKKEDADKLRNSKNFKIKGYPVTIIEEKETVFKVQKNNPQKNAPAPFKAFKMQTSKSTSATQDAQGKVKNVPNKQITKTVKKVPAKPKLKPTCKVSGESQKAVTSTGNPAGRGAVVEELDTADKQQSFIDKIPEPKPEKMTESLQQAMAESELPKKDVSDSQPPPEPGCPEPMEVDPCLTSEEQKQQTVEPQAELTTGQALAPGASPSKQPCDAESTDVQQQVPTEIRTDGAITVDAPLPHASEAALTEDAALPCSSATLVEEDAAAPGSDAAQVENSHRGAQVVQAEVMSKEDAGSLNVEATVKKDAAPPVGSDAAVMKDAASDGLSRESNTAAKKDVAPPVGSDEAGKKDVSSSAVAKKADIPSRESNIEAKKHASPPVGSDAAVRRDAASSAVVKKTDAPSHESSTAVKKDVAPPVGSDTAVKMDAASSTVVKNADTPSRETNTATEKDAAPPIGSDAEVKKDAASSTVVKKADIPSCETNTATKKDVAPPVCSDAAVRRDAASSAMVKKTDAPSRESSTAVKKDLAPPVGSDTAVKMDVASNTTIKKADAISRYETNTTMRKDAAPPVGSDAEVKKDGASSTVVKKPDTPSRETNTAMKKNAAPPVGSDAAVRRDAASSAVVKKTDAPARESSTAVKKDLAPSVGSDTAVKMDVGSNTTIKKADATSRYETNTTMRNDAAPPVGSDAEVKKNAASSTLVKKADTPLRETNTATKKNAAPPVGSGAEVKKDAASSTVVKKAETPSRETNTATRKDVAPPVSSDAAVRRDAATSTVVKKAGTPLRESNTAAKKDAASPPGFDANVKLTIGERLTEHLRPEIIPCFKTSSCFHKGFLKMDITTLMISNLPNDAHSYREEDIIDLFRPFGLDKNDEMVYIIPQTQMAFVHLTKAKSVIAVLEAASSNKLKLKGYEQELQVHVPTRNLPAWPAGFYQALMRMMQFHVMNNGQRTIFIKNIKLSEIASLRKALRKIDGVKNFLPLMNKVFVEFESNSAADRFGVWYVFHNRCPTYQLHRLGLPEVDRVSPPPDDPHKAMPDSGVASVGATVLTTQYGIPLGTYSPFYLTMGTKPFLFPTVSPWFIIPEFLTVRNETDIEKAKLPDGKVSQTLMLTGLPQGCYKHEYVARLVWPYFARKDLQTLYYNVIVLPLQRRAFVHFSDSTTCYQFVHSHLQNLLRVGGYRLRMHFVLQPMSAYCSEESMYTSLMRLSNSYVEEVESLAERLLCVETSETRKNTITSVLDFVSSHASYVNFLPLSNRICIEMTDSAGVAHMVKKFKDFKPDTTAWIPVKCFCSVKTLKERLQDPSEITLNPENSHAAPPSVAPPAAAPPNATPSSAAPPAVTSSDAAPMANPPPSPAPPATAPPAANPRQPTDTLQSAPQGEETTAKDNNEKVECSINDKTTAVPEVHDSKENISAKAEGGTLSSSACGGDESPAAPDVNNDKTTVVHKEKEAIPIKEEVLVKSDDVLEDVEKDFSSIDIPFDEELFNIDEFVTVDEIGDIEDSASEIPSLSKRSSSQDDLQPASKRTKLSASKEPKSATSSMGTRSSSRRSLSSASIYEPPKMSPKGRNKTKQSQTQLRKSQLILTTTAGEDEDLSTMNIEESFEVLDSIGEDQKPLSDEVSHMELNVSGDGVTEPTAAPEPDLGGVENVEEEQTQPSCPPKVEEVENVVGENEMPDVKEDVTDKEQISKSSQTNKDAVEALPSANIDRPSRPLEDSLASGQEEVEEEEEAYEVIDSLEEQPASSENEHSVPEPPKSRAASSRALRNKNQVHSSPKKQESTTAKPSEPEKYLVVDSLQVEHSGSTSTQGRRRSTRGKTQEQSSKTSVKDEKPTFHVTDSVEDEASVPMRATRGRRGRPPKNDASTENKSQGEKATAMKTTPSRTLHESAKDKIPMKKTETIIKEEPISQVLDQVKVSPATRGKGRKGRPKKEVKRIKREENDTVDEEDEAATFQVLDSVEDESGQDLPSTEATCSSPKNEAVTDRTSPVKLEEEEEATYQVVDSLEEDLAQEEASATDVGDPRKTEEQKTELADGATKCGRKQEADEKTEGALSKMKTTQDHNGKTDDRTPSTGALSLDQVSDDNEDFPDDAAEKSAKPKRRAEKQRQTSRRQERSGSSKRRSRRLGEKEELVTLDQVGTEESGVERAAASDVSEEELALVTLDELVLEQEEPTGKRPTSEGEQSESCLNPETLMTLDETGDEEDEDEKSGPVDTSHSIKRKHSDDTEDNTTLVTLDQVGDVEEDVLRCGIEKRQRSDSAAENSASANQDETEVASTCDTVQPPSIHLEEEEKEAKKEEEKAKEEEEVEMATQKIKAVEEAAKKEGEKEMEEDAASAGQAAQSSQQKLCKGKRMAELLSTAAKRSRSESPSNTMTFVLPPFKLNNPLGTEFVVPKSGYFCELCSIFYLKESTAKNVHCCSRKHYDNLKTHYRKCEENSRAATQGSISD